MKTHNYYKLFNESLIYGLNEVQKNSQINIIDCMTDYFYKELNKIIQEKIFNEFPKLRNASEEERQAVREYIENNSTITDINFFDLVEKL